MSFKRIFPVVFTCCFLFLFTAFCIAGPDTPASPSAYFPEKSFTFDPVVDGTEIIHDFILQNKGAGTLSIGKVTTD